MSGDDIKLLQAKVHLPRLLWESRPALIVLVSEDKSADFIGISLTQAKDGQAMTKAERENWIINLENISGSVDAETVKFVCRKYGVKSIYSLRSCDLSEAYSELFQYAVDADN